MTCWAVDITDLPNNAVRRGSHGDLLGEASPVDELAHHFGTIGYEVLTSLRPRYARVYKGGAAATEPLLRQQPDNLSGMKIEPSTSTYQPASGPNLLRWLCSAKPDVVALQD